MLGEALRSWPQHTRKKGDRKSVVREVRNPFRATRYNAGTSCLNGTPRDEPCRATEAERSFNGQGAAWVCSGGLQLWLGHARDGLLGSSFQLTNTGRKGHKRVTSLLPCMSPRSTGQAHCHTGEVSSRPLP